VRTASEGRSGFELSWALMATPDIEQSVRVRTMTAARAIE